MTTYFNLSAPDSDRLRATTEKSERREIVHCPNGHVARYRRTSNLALQLKHSYRNQMIIWSWISGVVVHDELLAEFARREFTGYRLKPATVRFLDGTISDSFKELVVTGWGGIACPESGIQVVKSCRLCHWKKYSGLKNAEGLVDWKQWSGEDFFIVWPLPNFILITERIANLLLSLDVKSFRLRGLEDIDPLVARSGFTVGQLSDYIPEDIALKYGIALGLE